MNSLQRIKNVISGEPIDRTPNLDIFMIRAVHHLGIPLSKYYLDYRVLCEVNIAALEAFDLDIVQAISDPYREACDVGLEVEFPFDEMPMHQSLLIREPEDLAKLHFPVQNFGARMTDRLEGIRAMREQVGDEVAVMGWVEGAFAEAADLRGINEIMTDVYIRPEWLKELLEKCVEMEIAFACAQVDAGAHMIGLGDAVASLISPRMYREFALPYQQRIFDAVKAKGAIPRLHICGKTAHIHKDMAQSGAQIVDVDWVNDLKKASEALDGLVVCGNLDPVSVFLQGTPKAVYNGVLENAKTGGMRWISAGGCEIPDETPIENLRAQTQALRDLGGRR
jgi:MtaA/CmuA family methyltransferase